MSRVSIIGIRQINFEVSEVNNIRMYKIEDRHWDFTFVGHCNSILVQMQKEPNC